MSPIIARFAFKDWHQRFKVSFSEYKTQAVVVLYRILIHVTKITHKVTKDTLKTVFPAGLQEYPAHCPFFPQVKSHFKL